LISHYKHAVESLTTLSQRPGQHSTPRDQPAARDRQPLKRSLRRCEADKSSAALRTAAFAFDVALQTRS
jgi:hypothetical protein